MKAQEKKHQVTEDELENEIPNRVIQKIQESRKHRYRKAHIEAEDSCMCSDTISNLVLKVGAEDEIK